MKSLKFGVVGTNFISDWFMEATDRVEGTEVSAVYSRAADTGEAFASRHGIRNIFTDYRKMLESDIDAVYIASPTFMHESQALAAMEYGKHVLCEKMMAASYPAAERMRRCAGERGVVLLEAMRPDFDPATAAITEAVGRIGRLRRAHLEYCQYSSRYDRFKAGEVLNAFNPQICNSALADIGVYPLHFAVRLFGSPKSLAARSVLLENGFEGMGQITLEYADMLVSVVYSKITESATPSVIEGEGGSVIFDRINSPTELWLKLRGREAERLHFDRVDKNMSCEVEAFRDMVAGRLDSAPHLDATLETVRIAHAAYVETGAIEYMNL